MRKIFLLGFFLLGILINVLSQVNYNYSISNLKWELTDNDSDGSRSTGKLSFRLNSITSYDPNKLRIRRKKYLLSTWTEHVNYGVIGIMTGGDYKDFSFTISNLDGNYDFQILIEDDLGFNKFEYDDDNNEFLNDEDFELATEDILSFLIPTASWINEIDEDNDGYTRSRKLLYQITRSSLPSQNVNVTIKVYKKLYSSTNYSLWSTLPDHNMDSNLENITTEVGGDIEYGLYDFIIMLFNNDDGGTFVADRDYSVDSDLYHQKFETASQDGQVPPPLKPINPTPGNEALNQSINIIPSWSNGGGATSYDVYFGTDSSPDAGEFKGNTTSSSYDPGSLAYNTKYYWRIDSKNSAGTTPGTIWGFTTQVEPPAPPTNPNPNIGAVNQPLNLVLSWTNGGGATSYDVYFGTDQTPDAGEFLGNLTSINYDLGNLAYNTKYFWRIDAKNETGTTTGAVWYFTTKQLQPPDQAINPIPNNGASNQSIYVNPGWSDGGGATSFDVYFGTDSSPDESEFKGNLTSSSFDPGTLIFNTTYYWRIDSKNSAGTTAGVVWQFITQVEPPIQAIDPSPTIGATNQSIDIDLSWINGGGATSYVVFLGTDPSPDDGEFLGNTFTASYDPGTLAYNTIYYWRIDAENEAGTTTGTVWHFTTKELTSPSQATDPLPDNGAINQPVNVGPSWLDGGGATSYDIYFGTDSSPDAGEYKGNITFNNFEPGTLAYNTTYYWRIDSKNSAGTTIGVIWQFTTQVEPPAQAINPTPINGAANQSIDVDISWSNGGGATNYDVYFGSDPSTDAGEYLGNTESSSYDPGILAYNTTYYWRVDAKNEAGTTPGVTWNLTTKNEFLPSPTQISATDGTYLDRIVISWNSVAGAYYYNLYRATVNDSLVANPIGNWQESRSYSDSNITPGDIYYYWVKAASNLLGDDESKYSLVDSGYAMPECNDPLEPNNEFTKAFNLESNLNYINNNLCLTEGDEDWFRFTYNATTCYFKVKNYNSTFEGFYGISFKLSGSIVTIETKRSFESTDTELYLYGTDTSEELDYDDDGGSEQFSRIVFDFTGSGLEENILGRYVRVYPNPFKEKVHIFLDRPNKITKVEINNISGEKLMQVENINSSSLELNMDELKSGVYLLTIYTYDGYISKKIIKK
jgi:hypothetical protein